MVVTPGILFCVKIKNPVWHELRSIKDSGNTYAAEENTMDLCLYLLNTNTFTNKIATMQQKKKQGKAYTFAVVTKINRKQLLSKLEHCELRCDFASQWNVCPE